MNHRNAQHAEGLLPCPFCGGQAQISSDDASVRKYWSVSCVACKTIIGYDHTSEGAAIMAWNRRYFTPGWQPIETAPKNPAGEFHGPLILIFSAADNMPWPAYWAPGKDGAGSWICFDDEEFATEDVSHWQPLPAVPA